MNRSFAPTMGVAGLLCLSIVLAEPARPQSGSRLVGSWTMMSSDAVTAAGGRTPTLGAAPTGNIVFTDDGRFIWLFLSTDLPKFASNNRAGGTAEENAAVVRGSISAYGTYAISGNDLIFRIEQSTFPNWRASEQKRTIVGLTADELKWTNPTGSTGGVAELVFRRTQ
jgi:Lipocalin-like domain